jgi:hypothetical protein
VDGRVSEQKENTQNTRLLEELLDSNEIVGNNEGEMTVERFFADSQLYDNRKEYFN